MAGRQMVSSSSGSRLRLAWDWYTDLGLGAWVLTGSVLVVGAFVVALVIGHGDARSSSCDDAQPYASLVDHYDGMRLTPHQVARLGTASTRLEAASRATDGERSRVLAEAAQVAGAALPGQRFHPGFVYGRFESVCDFSKTAPLGP